MQLSITKTTKTNFDAQTLIVRAGVRYWEDATVNGVEEDDDGAGIPCRSGDLWCPVIEIETGKIQDWPDGTTAKVHFKVCDAGKYWLADKDGNRLQYQGDYVPEVLAPGGEGYGDYIIMTIGADGVIEGWKATFDEDDWQ